MTTRILIVGDPATSRLPALKSPSPWDAWEPAWSPHPGPADLRDAGLVVLDLTAGHPDPAAFADLIAQTPDVPRLAVTAGPAAVPGIDTIDASAHPDLSAEVFAQLERLQVTAKVRWLHGLGGDAFVGQILDLVVIDVPKALAGISAATQVGDGVAAGKLAHQLKSTAGNVGAQTVHLIAAQVEADTQAGNTAGLRELAGELAKAWDRVAPTIDAHLRRASA